MAETKLKDNAIQCPNCGNAYFESEVKCPKCGTLYQDGAESKTEKRFNQLFDKMNDVARRVHSKRNKYGSENPYPSLANNNQVVPKGGNQ